ncbi:MAG: EAL domain-containing protein [Gammaproteobacteria bacterium]|nr:EAL domain-containing protein [Gammaproteobacteria bacterium]
MGQEERSDPSVIKEQSKLLFSSAYSAVLANIGTALIFYLLIIDSGISGYAGYWFVIFLGIAISRMAVTLRFNDEISAADLQRSLKLYFVTILLLSTAWGFAYVMQYQLGNDDVRNFTLLIYLGLVAASISTMSAWLPSMLAFVFPQLTMMVVILILEGEIVSYYTALAVLVYSMLMLVLAKNLNRNLIDSLELKSVNLNLIDNLNEEVEQRAQAQRELEKHQADLEKVVEERTQELVGINENLQREIDERQQVEQNLRFAEHYDQLTELPNRVLLLDRIKHAISSSAREEWMVAVLFLGIDRFKKINDSLGHAVGDKLLQQVASRLELLLREGDTVARNSGDEFVVVLERIDRANAAELVARKVIASLNDMFNIDDHDIHVGVSIGIAVFPFDGDGPQQLLESADTAMHRAKQKGGNNSQFYAEGMSKEIRDRLDMESRLRFAVDLNELFMVYQPQVDSITGETVGFEALIRWENPDLGLVRPDQFIPLLEENGMINSVGEWIIKDVVRFIQSGGAQDCRVSINLSARQCSQAGLGDFIHRVVNEYAIDPSKLEFELTESMLIDDFKSSTALITQLQDMGCTIALDDFGTGYTSMGYLAQLNIDVIKIDRSFITGIDSDDNLRKIVYAIIGMSQSLEIENVIEGVETAEELATVQALGGRVIQGYLYSKPLRRGAELEDWFSR